MSYFAGALGVRIPEQFGDHIVANCLTTVGKALKENCCYAEISPEDREAWRTAVQHNKWDLTATAEICKMILEGKPRRKGFQPPAGVMRAREKEEMMGSSLARPRELFSSPLRIANPPACLRQVGPL